MTTSTRTPLRLTTRTVAGTDAFPARRAGKFGRAGRRRAAPDPVRAPPAKRKPEAPAALRAACEALERVMSVAEGTLTTHSRPSGRNLGDRNCADRVPAAPGPVASSPRVGAAAPTWGEPAGRRLRVREGVMA